MFHSQFLDRFRDFLDSSLGSRVLLLPSTRDILSDHAVFPQPELSRKLYEDSVRCIHFVKLLFWRGLADGCSRAVAHTPPAESRSFHGERSALRGEQRRRPLPPPQGGVLQARG